MAWVIIPAYNEAERITRVIREVQEYAKNVLIVDDGSTDATAEEARSAGAQVLQHSFNLGKGAALKTGCDYALKQGVTQIVVMDADGQHAAEDIPKFVQALEQHDIAFSYRQANKQMPIVLKFGNNFINKTLSTLFGIDVQDSQSGYRAFTADAYRKIRWKARDYYMETEMMIRAGQHKLKHTHIPIATIYGDRYKGTTVIDGIMIVIKMLGQRIFR
jgi:polyprenyl-phospho-N-acetylgalactosaminyl synthase